MLYCTFNCLLYKSVQAYITRNLYLCTKERQMGIIDEIFVSSSGFAKGNFQGPNFFLSLLKMT